MKITKKLEEIAKVCDHPNQLSFYKNLVREYYYCNYNLCSNCPTKTICINESPHNVKVLAVYENGKLKIFKKSLS